MPKRATKADRRLLEDAARAADEWRRDLHAGKTARRRARAACAEYRGQAEVPLSALPGWQECEHWHLLYSGDHPEDA